MWDSPYVINLFEIIIIIVIYFLNYNNWNYYIIHQFKLDINFNKKNWQHQKNAYNFIYHY